MHFVKEKHSNGYVTRIDGVVARYRKTGEVINGKEMYSAEFMDTVTFDLSEENEAIDWIYTKYLTLLEKLNSSLDPIVTYDTKSRTAARIMPIKS